MRGLLSESIHPLWYYNSCACDFSITASSATLLLGESTTVTAELVSSDTDGIYDDSACDISQITISPTSDLMTYDSSTAIATFETVDGSDTPISGAVSSSTFTFKWTTTTGLETDLTFDLDVTPACTYSAISWSPSVLPITL